MERSSMGNNKTKKRNLLIITQNIFKILKKNYYHCNSNGISIQ